MAAPRASWFTTNTLVHHGKHALAQPADFVRNDPNTVISLYSKAPSDDISLIQLEEWGIARLKSLKGIEQLLAQNKKESELRDSVKKLLDKHMKVTGSPSGTAQLDVCSHFILRLAFCTTEDNRRWFLARECDLFKHKYYCLSSAEKAEFLKQCELPYAPATEEDVTKFRTQLSQVLYHTGKGKPSDVGRPQSEPMSVEALLDIAFIKVPFENVHDLVGSRRVFLNNGFAYVPSDYLCSVITPIFRHKLSHSMVMAAGKWAALAEGQENDRLGPILRALASRQYLEDAAPKAFGDGTRVTLDQVPALAQRNFPLCMQHLYTSLVSDRHLRHGGRMQFSLFLKKAGLTLEESLYFWKTSFAPRTPAEKFDKEYAYNIRHSYGKEGRRKDYEAYNCSKVISSNPGVGDAHGCPYKTFQADNLKAALVKSGLPNHKVVEVMKLAREGHYQVACDRNFEGMFGERLDKLVEHPNEYLAASITIDKSRDAKQAAVHGGQRDNAMIGTPQTTARSPGPVLNTPLTGDSTQDQTFVRTPINAFTPTLGHSPQLNSHRGIVDSKPRIMSPLQTPPQSRRLNFDSPVKSLQDPEKK